MTNRLPYKIGRVAESLFKREENICKTKFIEEAIYFSEELTVFDSIVEDYETTDTVVRGVNATIFHNNMKTACGFLWDIQS